MTESETDTVEVAEVVEAAANTHTFTSPSLSAAVYPDELKPTVTVAVEK